MRESEKESRDDGRITVAHVAGGLFRGGVEMVIYRYLSHMNPDHYRWIFICYNPPDQDMQRMFEKKEIRVYQVTGKKKNLLKSCYEVWKILKENQVQILHSNIDHMCFLTSILGMAAGIKVRITHVHTAYSFRGIKKMIYRICARLSMWTTTSWFACGRDVARSFYGKKAARRAVIMHNAFEYEDFRFDPRIRQEMRKAWNLEGYTVLGHVGRFAAVKNHEFLLRVFARYHAQDENSRLVLVGAGPLLEQVKARAAELGVREAVLFIPPTEEVNRWFMAMDVFVMPSVGEGFSIAALEAQVAGLPVVLSSGIPREICISKKVRFLDLEEDVQVWCDQIRSALASGRSGDLHAEFSRRHFDIEEEAKKLDHFYRYGVWE